MTWHDHESTHAPPRRPFRARVARLSMFFVLIQAVVAVIVSIRSTRARERREASRPSTYPSTSFSPVRIEHGDDEIKLYMCGVELFDDVVDAIDAARSQVLIETFIWSDDEVGRRVRDAVDRATERGVEVFVLWDWLLSDRSVDESYFPAGVQTHVFRRLPMGPGLLRPSNVLRNHRKLVVVDQHVAFTGGYNIGDEYQRWRDTHVRVTGVGARDLANAFSDFWNTHTPATKERVGEVSDRSWEPHLLVHRNDPTTAIFPIRGMYLEAIDRAQERVWITNPYFVPDRSFRTSLGDAARRGVDVRVMLPVRSNHPLTDTLAHGVFEELLVAGVRVFLYRDFMLHAKTALVDTEWCTVGTANIDRWSLFGNHEINVEVRSPRAASQLAEIFELDLTNCNEVHLDGWRRRSLPSRVAERVLRSLAPLM